MKGTFTVVIALLLVVVGATVASDFLTARQRSLQKRTMAAMRDAGQQLRQGRQVTPFEDAWGTPVRIRTSGPHNSIRSAGRDRKFEATADARGVTSTRNEPGADIVWFDDSFAQFPDGISFFEPPPVGYDPTTRPCASCHPAGAPKR